MKQFTCCNFPSALSNNPWRWCTKVIVLEMWEIFGLKSKSGCFIGTSSIWSSIHMEAATAMTDGLVQTYASENVKKEPQ